MVAINWQASAEPSQKETGLAELPVSQDSDDGNLSVQITVKSSQMP